MNVKCKEYIKFELLIEIYQNDLIVSSWMWNVLNKWILTFDKEFSQNNELLIYFLNWFNELLLAMTVTMYQYGHKI